MACPLAVEEERPHLEDEYGAELRSEAGKRGVEIFERDGRFIAHPQAVRMLPGEQAVWIDRRQTTAIRPR